MSAGATVDATVRLQALDGTWETCGADRAIGVRPETLTYSHNEWGADKASFDLHRSVIALWPDLGAFTPVEIEVGGVLVWEGRTAETPTRAGAEQIINVQCAGWQYQLDDDVFQRTYVHSKLTDWKDTRSFLEADLTRFKTSGSVQSGQGGITLGYAKGSKVDAEQGVAVTLDLGPAGPGAVMVQTQTTLVGTATNFSFYAILHDGWGTGYTLAGREDSTNAHALETGTIPAVVTATGHRYVTLLVFYSGAEQTMAADMLLTFTAVRVFTDSAYQTAGASILKASTIVKDALERATLLLSSDLSQVAATTFAIPDFSMSKASTPREAIEAANAYHNYIAKLLSGRRVSFQPRPTDPVLEIGAWSGAEIEDASANNGAEIYNRALVEAQGPDGSPLEVERSASQQPGVLYVTSASPAPDNPSFATNTTSWTTSNGAIARDTTIFHSAPASGALSRTTRQIPTFVETFTGTFLAGVQYRLTLFVQRSARSALGTEDVVLELGTTTDAGIGTYILPGAGEWVACTVAWTPRATVTGVKLWVSAVFVDLWVDDLVLTAAKPTLVDRRSFRRTKVIQMSSAITPAEGVQLADIFLQGHMTTPFKGAAAVSPGGVRRVLGGQPVHPSQIGLHAQELLRVAHMLDPDTGGIGRDGTIAEVSYTHKDQKAQVTLDDKRGNFDALLSRLAVVQSVGS